MFLGYCRPIELFSNLGEKISFYRKHLGLTQKQLSQKPGIAPLCLLICENRKRNPTKKIIEKLELALKAILFVI